MVRAIGDAVWRRLNGSPATRDLDDANLSVLSPFVVVAPHPDDETLGCGGLLAAACRLRLDPRVVFLTDGGASHPGSTLWPRERLVKTRRAEALAALSRLGVDADAALFLEWPDTEPHQPGSLAYRRTVKRVRAWLSPAPPRALLAPWRVEPHCDHRAASDLTDDVARLFGARRLDYLVWGWTLDGVDRQREADQCWRLSCGQHRAARRAALFEHRTQTTNLITDAADAFQIPPAMAALTDRPSELFFEARPPHA